MRTIELEKSGVNQLQVQVPHHPTRRLGPQLKIQFYSPYLLQDSFLTHSFNF